MSGVELSVVLPIYNAAATLPAAVQSLLAQDFSNFVIIAVDDGSSEAVPLPADPRIRFFQRPHQGLVETLNFALAQCDTPFIARMDADDLALPSRFSKQLAWFARDAALGVLGCQVEGFATIGGLSTGMQRYLDWLNRLTTHEQIFRERFVESPLVHPSAMWRREVAVEYRHDHGPEDYDLWLTLLGRGVRFGKVDEVLLRWRDDAGRATRTDPRYAKDRFFDCKLAHLLPLCRGRTIAFIGAGIEGKPFLKALHTANVQIPIVYDADPRKQGNIIHGARVVAPDYRVDWSDPLYLCAIGVPEARDQIRALFADRAREGENLLFLA